MVKLSDDEGNQLMAEVCHQLRIPVPGPGAGMQILHVVKAIDKAMCGGGMSEKKVGPALEIYRDALMFVAGVWGHQQKLTIDALARAVGTDESTEAENA